MIVNPIQKTNYRIIKSHNILRRIIKNIKILIKTSFVNNPVGDDVKYNYDISDWYTSYDINYYII